MDVDSSSPTLGAEPCALRVVTRGCMWWPQTGSIWRRLWLHTSQMLPGCGLSPVPRDRHHSKFIFTQNKERANLFTEGNPSLTERPRPSSPRIIRLGFGVPFLAMSSLHRIRSQFNSQILHFCGLKNCSNHENFTCWNSYQCLFLKKMFHLNYFDEMFLKGAPHFRLQQKFLRLIEL